MKPPAQSPPTQHNGIIYWMIASLKFAKGVLLLAVGVGALTLIGKDVADQAAHLVEVFSVDPQNTYVQALLVKITHVDDRALAQIGAGTFVYSGVFLTEGIGLFLRKRWAEYFTIVVTASFIPIEIYELIEAFSAAKAAILLANVGVVAYLAVRIRRAKVTSNGPEGGCRLPVDSTAVTQNTAARYPGPPGDKPFTGAPHPRVLANVLAVTALLWAIEPPRPAAGAPVRARHTEGAAHGVLRLTDTADDTLAYGELIQWEEGHGSIASRLLIRFNDGSVYDEIVHFSQRPALRLLSYKLTQRGPSFTETSEVSFDRNGHYSARVKDAGKDEEKASGSTPIPDDVSNGMTSLVLKNLPPGASATTHLMAFTPKPQVLELHLAPEGSEQFAVGSTTETLTRFLMQPKVPGVKGVVATVSGKQPPSFRMWLTPEPAPAMWRFEGPLYADGPIWRITPSSPSWKD